jgi:hypothetical protein
MPKIMIALLSIDFDGSINLIVEEQTLEKPSCTQNTANR